MMQVIGRARTLLLPALAVTMMAAVAVEAQHLPPEPKAAATSASGLPVPRFVSLKSDRVNMRTGPGTEYPTQWVYRRAGLPVEVIREFEGWRQIRDSEGATGWVLGALLSGRRTALLLPWEVKPGVEAPEAVVLEAAREGAPPVAAAEAGVIANIRSCDGRWCFIAIGDIRGYVEQSKFWGVYPGEVVK